MNILNVLVVDHDSAYCDLVRLALSIGGCFVSSFPDIQTAHEGVGATWPNLMLINVDVLGTLPAEGLNQMRVLFPNVRMVLLADRHETVNAIAHLGVRCVIRKPFDYDRLQRLLEQQVA